MAAEIIEGRRPAQTILNQVGDQLKYLPRTPGLAVVLVGDDQASHIYVRSKIRVAKELGLHAEAHVLPGTADESEVISIVQSLNERSEIDGVLIQVPLPQHIDPRHIMSTIDPRKDVDGLHSLNAGRTLHGVGDALVSCTPLGCMRLIKSFAADLAGAHAVIIGTSNIVGKPMAALLLDEHSTVTQAHIHTRDTRSICRSADILVSATGKPSLVRGDWIKPGAIVIDVGTTRVAKPEGGYWVKGDVMFEEALDVAGAITPVPGGVGPMTIACLMENTLKAAKARLA